MNKLVYIITRKKHAANLIKDLLAQKFFITELEANGGFSREKLSIILLGTDEEKIDNLLQITKKNCSSHEEININGVPLPVQGQEDIIQSQAGDKVRVKVGGATVFITNLERMEKI